VPADERSVLEMLRESRGALDEDVIG